MQPPNNKDTINIGTVVGVHGIKGTLKIKVYGDFFFECMSSRKILLLDPSKNETKSISIESVKHCRSDVFLCKIEGINDRNHAEYVVRYELLVPKQYLPKTKQNEFYNFSLIGSNVIYDNTIIGQVKNIQNFGSEDLLEIELISTSKTEYFPFTKKDILSIDEENKNIVINKNSTWIQNLLGK